MKTAIHSLLYTAAGAALLLTGCVGDLDQYPHTDTTSKDVYVSVGNYESVLSGIYTSLIVNLSSISGDDRYQNYTRSLMMFQECSADAIDDVWISGESMTDVNNQSWTAGDPWVSAIYYHIYNIVSLSNEFIRNASEGAIGKFSDSEQAQIRIWRDEARCIRALAYYHALDLFPAASFVTEDDPVGSYIPPVYTRRQLFAFIESELRELGTTLPQTNYGHMNRAAAWTLLARMYLNAKVYTGEDKYSECISCCREVIKDGYSLEPDYARLFNADNHKRTNEIIFALACNATHTVAWGAGTYLVCATRFDNDDGMMEDFGVSAYWNCLRVRPQLVDLFQPGDRRAMFGDKDRIYYDNAPDDYYAIDGDTKYKYRDRSKEIIGHDETTSGWLLNKWSNLTDDRQAASDTRVNGAETDYPIFRLADVYLMLAEAVVRGGEGATRGEALELVNLVRKRAYGNDSGDISDSQMTLDFLLDERGRELYSESIRRTDLIRFNKYTSGYRWNWKGGVKDGTDVHDRYAFLPIPEAELSANPTLKSANTELGY